MGEQVEVTVRGKTYQIEIPEFPPETIPHIIVQWVRRKLAERFTGASEAEIENALPTLGDWLLKVASGVRAPVVGRTVDPTEKLALELLSAAIVRKTGVKKADAMRKAKELRAAEAEVWQRAYARAQQLGTEEL